MATLTYSNIETRVMNRLRIPTTNSTQATIVAGIINDVYRDIYMMEDWWWLEDRQVLNTVADYVTGTISLTSGSTAATLSAAPTGLGSFVNRVLSVPGNTVDSGAIFRISAHTANATAVTLDVAYTGATATAATYSIYQDEYDLATDVGKVLRIKRFGYPWPLSLIGPTEMAEIKAYDTSEGKPQIATVVGFDTAGDPTTQRQLIVHPYPDDLYRLEIFFKQALNTELSGTTRPLIPDDYVQLLVYGALARGYPQLLNDTERGKFHENLFNDLLKLMKAAQRERAQDRPQVTLRDDYRRYYRRRRYPSPASADLGSYFDRWPVRF